MILIIILLVLLFFFGWILFMPLIVDADTARSKYQVYQLGTVRFWLTSGLEPRLRVFGISIPVNKKSKKAPEPKHVKQPEHKSKKHFSILQFQKLISRIFRSIRIIRFYLDLDTDDVTLNARMIPVFAFLSRGPVHLVTNFEGRVCARLQAEIKLYSIVWAFLLFFTTKK